jgi:hypothetical protein
VKASETKGCVVSRAVLGIVDGADVDALHHVSDLRQADRRLRGPGLEDGADPLLYPLSLEQGQGRMALGCEASPLEGDRDRDPISQQKAKAFLLVPDKPSHIGDQGRKLLPLGPDHIPDT